VNIDLEQGIRMLVTPAPVSLLIVVIELRKIAIFAMVLFGVRTIRLIFILVPFVIVIFVLVVIDDLGFLIRGPKRCRYECYWGHQGGAQYGFIPETGHVYSPVQQHSKYRATHSPSAELTTRENAKSAELRSADAAGPARALRVRVWSKAADTECDIRQERVEGLNGTKERLMFLTLFVILLVMWLLGLFAFHVAGGLIHILLIVAVISLLVHLFRRRSAA
jgi:hypothetical protein